MYNKVKALVSKVRNKMMMSDRGVQESITIYNELLEAGYIKKVPIYYIYIFIYIYINILYILC
jgi:hypothetical protein